MRRVQSGVLVLALALLAACGGTGSTPVKPAAPTTPASAPHSGPAKALPKVTLRLNIPANGSMAPFFVALAKGYYRAAGLDMTTIGDGHGSVITAEDVANGHDTFGYSSADSVAGVISKGAPLKMVAVWFQQNPAVILFKAGAPIHKPADLYGKKVGVPTGATAQQMWQAFMAATHLDSKRVQTVNVSVPQQATALATGRVDAISVFAYGFVPAMDQLGIKTREFRLSHYGIGDLAGGIVVPDALLSAHPQWVRAFLAATVRGFQFAQAHPAQAIAVERRYRPNLKAKTSVEQLKLALQLLHTKASQHDPLGYMVRSDWQATLATAHRFEGMKKVLPVADYYTNAYLPGAK